MPAETKEKKPRHQLNVIERGGLTYVFTRNVIKGTAHENGRDVHQYAGPNIQARSSAVRKETPPPYIYANSIIDKPLQPQGNGFAVASEKDEDGQPRKMQLVGIYTAKLSL